MSSQVSELYEKHATKLANFAALLLTAVIALMCAKLFWAVWPQPQWQPAPVTNSSRAESAKSVQTLANEIAGLHLFGSYSAPKVDAPKQSVEDAPDTRLNLTLLGILSDSRNQISRALISQANGDEKAYAIDQEISNGVTLNNIYSDRVILSRNGTLETLRLDKDKPSSAAILTPVENRSAQTATNAVEAPDPQRLASIREELLNDPGKAQQFIRVVPSRDSSGSQTGYRIYPGRDRALFNAAGLRPGDLITGVNGVELNDPSRALQLIGDLSQSNSLNVTVLRGGQSQNISVDLN